MHTPRALACAVAFGAASFSACGGTEYEVVVLDFEGLAEGTPVREQFAPEGVTFAIDGHGALAPIICVAGYPATGFGNPGAGSADEPMPSGVGGLTDPTGATVTNGLDIVATFAEPTGLVRFTMIDIDGGAGQTWRDSVTARAYDASGALVASRSVRGGDPGTGESSHVVFELIGSGIARVVIDVIPSMGYAIDDFAFLRPLPEEEPGGEEPGGEEPGGEEPGGEEPGGEEPGPDDEGGPDGGGVTVPGLTLTILCNFYWMPEDGDPRVEVTAAQGGGVVHRSGPITTGSYTIPAGTLACGREYLWCVVVDSAGRRTRYWPQDPLIRGAMAGDLNIDGVVDTADIGVFLLTWRTGGAEADVNGDGMIDVGDVGALLSRFGESCR